MYNGEAHKIRVTALVARGTNFDQATYEFIAG